MADSDNTRTMPSVTRRKLLTATTIAAMALPFHNNSFATADTLAGNPSFDPALALWNDWRRAYLATIALCRKQQRLETSLVKTIGFPKVEVYRPGEEGAVVVCSPDAIDEVFGDNPAYAELRRKAEADLVAHQARWNTEDRRIGYSAALRAERIAVLHKQDIAEALMSTPATTLAGIAGKLDAVMREGESSEECDEFPWPELHAILTDLVRIANALQPGSFMLGSDHTKPYPRRSRDRVSASVTMSQRHSRMT